MSVGSALPLAGALVAVAAIGIPVLVHRRNPDVIDITAGLVLLVAGAQTLVARRTRLTGVMLVITSICWFAPNLSGVAPVLNWATLTYLIPLIAALILGSGTAWGYREWALLALTAATAATTMTGGSRGALICLGLAVLAYGAWTWRSLPHRASGAASAYLVAVLAMGGSLVGISAARWWAAEVAPWVLLTGHAALLAGGTVALSIAATGLRRLAALDVGTDVLRSLDAQLARVTGDPQTFAAIRVAPGRWVRLDGSPVTAAPTRNRSAVLVSSRPVPARHQSAVGHALRLAADNVRSRVAVADRVRELEELRGRLVHVEEQERAALLYALRTGPLTSLSVLQRRLERANASAELLEHVTLTEQDITRVAVGLDPLSGAGSLAIALKRMAEELGAMVDIEPVEVDDTIARTLWFAAAEALTNAAKHAPGSQRTIRLRPAGERIRLAIEDDGTSAGSTPHTVTPALRDRVAAAGGTVTTSAGPFGTRLEIVIPRTRHRVARSRDDADAAPAAPG